MIKDDNIILRALEPSDADLLYEWENNMQLWQVSNTLTPFSKHLLLQFINTSDLDIYQTKQVRLMIDFVEKDITTTVGMIDMFDFDPYHNRAGLGIMLHESWLNKGIAFKALKLFINYASTVLGIHNLYCNIGSQNAKSISLFQKLGFNFIGNKKEWIKTQNGYLDELMFQFITSSDTGNSDNNR
jgi:diamine N-acetyltransferase